jgi:hypothetical protein
MQDLKNLNTKKVPNFKLSTFKKREVKQLESFYKQGGKWYSLKTGKPEKGGK